ncbi:MAG: DUF3048 domain-containing protein, partial [Anaerolineae bacterium]|nr:DUF3048 domain-containing protein [Anaerolineae bacterium]
SPVIKTPQTNPDGETKPQPPLEINPLTGLKSTEPDLLNRRPIVVKVENLPRNNRPQFGLSRADLVYEYHTEEGTTRYAAVFYGQNATRVGPIRSGRWFDINLVHMYKSIFIFGSAYERLLNHLLESDFGDRIILEGPVTAEALKRFDPNGQNLLLADLSKLQGIFDYYHIDNSPQDLSGMTFDQKTPEGGKDVQRIFVRYSGAIYNRWDYDAASNRFLRFVDAEDDINREKEVYVQMVDRETEAPITADNVVILLAKNFVVEPNVYDIELTGSQTAYLLRDGKILEVKWKREKDEDVLSLVDANGDPVAFKPGTTWFEVLSLPAEVKNIADGEWRFGFIMPEAPAE